jgi:hypothetical protein
MEDTISLEVNLRGGEAMYVTPVSHSYCDKDRKFYIYDTLEFLPRIPLPLRWVTYQSRLHDIRLWCFKLTKLARATKVIAEVFLDNFPRFTGASVFDPWFKYMTWEWWDSYLVSKELNHKWFYAVDIFQPYEPLHIEGNIEVDYSNVDKYIQWCDDGFIYYLPPSSLWIEERLRERFHVWTFDKEEDKVAENKFWKWRQEQIDKGYEVYYITSLET